MEGTGRPFLPLDVVHADGFPHYAGNKVHNMAHEAGCGCITPRA